ncbi:MAG: argininosuccinate synthase [Sedimentisphaerales bacterium]|nr:argininosuccinate synthase [Sedimentisphaerales bacterium]
MAQQIKKIVLAYSGGLDTSVILPWLKEKYGCRVIAFAADLGQGDELLGLKKKALASGADQCIVADLRDEFVSGYLWPLLQSGAVYEYGYLLGTSIARPLIAKEQVRVAQELGADAVAHGATGKGNDQVRFELTFMALDPTLKIVAPWKDPTFELTSRDAALAYARQHGIPVQQSKKSLYSRDRNIWHLSHEGEDLEDPANEPQDSLYGLSRPVTKAPDKPEYVEIGFEKGIPVKLAGKKISGVHLLEQLNRIGGKHGVGQVDLVENRLVGMKSRGVYETPGGTILVTAHRALEMLCLDRETLHYKQQIALRYAELVYEGKWFTPLRQALDRFVAETQQTLTGSVRLKLYKGNCRLAGTRSPHSLYAANLASFTMGAEYDSTDATGFIRLLGLPLKVRAMQGRKAKGKK